MFKKFWHLNDGGRPCYGPDAIYIGMKKLGYPIEDRPRKESLHSNSPPRVQGKLVGAEVVGDFGVQKVDSPDLVLADVRTDIDKIPKGLPIAVLDGEDDDKIRENFYKIATLYFKREFTSNWASMGKARPFPFGVVRTKEDPGILASKREIDVSFTMALHYPTIKARKKIFDSLDHKKIKLVTGFWDYEKYKTILDNSKISISARGGGWDTYRYWEIIHRGAVLCSEGVEQVIEIPHCFDKERICFSTDHLDSLNDILWSYLERPHLLDEMQQAAWDKLLKYHTEVRRAEYILEETYKL